MRRIYINDVIMQLAEQYVDDLTNNSRKVLNWRKNDMPKNKLNNFLLFLKDSYPVHANYVSKIIELYEDILLLKPSQFQTFHEAHFSEGTQDMLEKRFSYTDSNKQFYSYIIDCMRYDAIRSDLMRQYIKEMHIKTCVYCNAQYAITTEEFIDGDGKKSVWALISLIILCLSHYIHICVHHFLIFNRVVLLVILINQRIHPCLIYILKTKMMLTCLILN